MRKRNSHTHTVLFTLTYMAIFNFGLFTGTSLAAGYVSLATSSTGVVHACYYDANYGTIQYIKDLTGNMVTENVTAAGNYESFSSLILDAFGKAHISFYDKTLKALQYATNQSGVWTIEDITKIETGNIPSSSIAVDSQTMVHVVYSYFISLTGGSGSLIYATNSSGIWSTEDLNILSFTGGTPSIAIDKSNAIHVSYSEGFYAGLKYATNLSGSWVFEDVDESGRVGSFSSIGIDKFGKAHISYYDDSTWALKYANNIPGSWSTQIVDRSGHGGIYTSLALDDHDKVHISYISAYPDGFGFFTLYNVKYASNIQGNWLTSIINDNKRQKTYTSIALDHSGKVYIGYVNTSSALSLATKVTNHALGDVNFDGYTDVSDLVYTLKVVAGLVQNSAPNLISDINNDGLISMAEAIFILQEVAGLR